MLYRIGLCVLFLSSVAFAQSPELPREYLDTRYVPASGATINVAAGGNLQAALNQAQAGDQIVLQAGAVFTGNFVIGVKAGAGVLIVRSSDMTPEGVRVSPADSAHMPRIISPNASPALSTIGPASNYRFVGIEFTATGTSNGIVVFGTGQETDVSQLPSNLIIDRCFIHGAATAAVKRGVTINCARMAIIDSYISDIHGIGLETQAVCGWNGPGPLKVVNNYLEGATENFMLGGAGAAIPNLIASDVEFRHNTLAKPVKWNPNDATYAGLHWSVKNIFELKNAQRVLIDGNVFEYVWVDAQIGFAIQLTPRNQDSNNPWVAVRDITFTNNIVRHAAGGMNFLGFDNEHPPSQQSQRILVRNNLFDDIGGSRWGGNGRLYQILNGVLNLTIDHNTAFQTDKIITADLLPSPGLIFTNNLQPHNQYGVFGSDHGIGLDTLNYYFPGYVFAGNALVAGISRLYPAGNYFPTNQSSVGYTDLSGGNYALLAGSPLHNAATDGKDVGCDFAALNAAQNGPPAVPPPPGDTTPPQVLNLSAMGTGEFSVLFTFQTDEPSTAYVEFWYQGARARTLIDSHSLSHTFSLDFLSPGTTVNFTVTATDAAGNVTTTPAQTVRTLPLVRTVQIVRD